MLAQLCLTSFLFIFMHYLTQVPICLLRPLRQPKFLSLLVSFHLFVSTFQQKKVYQRWTISIYYKDTMNDLVKLKMVDFDIILGMDQLYTCYAFVIIEIKQSSFSFLIIQSLIVKVIQQCLSVILSCTLRPENQYPRVAYITKLDLKNLVMRHHKFSQILFLISSQKFFLTIFSESLPIGQQTLE